MFIHLDEAVAGTWLEQEPGKPQTAQLLAGFDLWERQHQTHPDYPVSPIGCCTGFRTP